jgi:2-polyprenyl-6-methoxyphenol hydroxylase-like FAD-dependent oxidoreductase
VSSPTSEGAVILHPPDIGEGVNAGLEDVAALMKRSPKRGKMATLTRHIHPNEAQR